jgi:transglutaminase-like putative cysteine protease
VNIRLTVAAGMATVLASIALYPLLASGSWFWGGVGAVIVIGGVGLAARRRPIPAVAGFNAALVGLFLYLNAVFAHRRSWAGVVPTWSSVRYLKLLVTQAAAETHHGPPVPARPGIVLVAVAGIGLVAALTDVLAVRLHRPALAGLPLLVLFCVPLTTNVKPGATGTALVFCAGVVGYLGLLSADGRYRLRLWGRVVHPWKGEAESADPDVRPVAAASRRIGFVAVVLALFLPLLVPGLRTHRLFAGSGGGTGGGGQGSSGAASFPRPLDLLNTDLHERRPLPVLSYRSTGPGTPPYLQLYVLTRLTTSEWTMAPATGTEALGSGGAMPRAPGLAANTSVLGVHEAISLASGLGNGGKASYLPLPYPPQQVKVGGSWRVDPGTLTVHSAGAGLAGLHYTVIGKNVEPTPQQLRQAGSPAGLAADTAVPPGFDRLKSLAEERTRGRTTEYGKAVALQAWFHRDFKYSLTTGLSTGASALTQFLRVTRTGSCQQFAFGMAVLARLLGIPSRVAIGFTQGTPAGNDTWQVKTSDAHAWPELYFNGAGWLAFEPTPPNAAGPAGQGTATVPAYANPQLFLNGPPNLRNRQNASGPAPSPTASRSGANLPGKLTAPGGAAAIHARQRKSPVSALMVAMALLAVLLLTPGISRLIRRRWRWWTAHDDVTRAHAAWRELCDDLADHRMDRGASESPRGLTGRIAESLGLTGADRAALQRVADAEERACYAPSPAASARLQTDSAQVRRALARASAPSARWAARIVPSSVLASARTGLRHALDVIESATTRAWPRRPVQRRA